MDLETQLWINSVQCSIVVILIRRQHLWEIPLRFVDQSFDFEFPERSLGTSGSGVSEFIAPDATMTQNPLKLNVTYSSSDLAMN